MTDSKRNMLGLPIAIHNSSVEAQGWSDYSFKVTLCCTSFKCLCTQNIDLDQEATKFLNIVREWTIATRIFVSWPLAWDRLLPFETARERETARTCTLQRSRWTTEIPQPEQIWCPTGLPPSQLKYHERARSSWHTQKSSCSITPAAHHQYCWNK